MELKNYPVDDSLFNVLEDYIKDRRKGSFFSVDAYKRRLKMLQVPQGQILEIMVRMENEWEIERLAKHDVKNGKMFLFLGAMVVALFGTVSLLSVMDLFFKGKIQMYMLGAIAVGFLVALKGYNEMRVAALRKKRRQMKWEALVFTRK